MEWLDCVEKTRFLGKEFLTWLWFRAERQQGLFELDGIEPFELFFDDRLVLDVAVDHVREVNAIRSENPTDAAEAKVALQTGKKVTEVRLHIYRDEQEWKCAISAEELALSGVRVPGVLSKEDDEVVLERMMLLDELEAMLDGLWQQFLRIRLDPEAWPTELAALRSWAFDEAQPAAPQVGGEPPTESSPDSDLVRGDDEQTAGTQPPDTEGSAPTAEPDSGTQTSESTAAPASPTTAT